MLQKSPTFDEQGFITRGLGYVRGENEHMRVGHPLGLNALNAAFLAFDATVVLPVTDPSWAQTSFHRPSELFMWEIGNDVARIMFLARLPTVFLGMLLTAVAGRWTIEITHSKWAGLLAILLLALDPNILAHSRLTTTDLGLAAATLLASFLLWRFWQRPSWLRAVAAGIGFGLLQNTKFTAGLFVPLFALVILVAVAKLWRENGRFPTKPLLQFAVAYPLSGFLALWAAYGFQVGTLPANLPTFPQLSGLTLPLSHHLEQLLDIGGRMQKGTPSFLLGQYGDSGWWYYFPVAFLLKTPIPTLFLFGWTAVVLLLRRQRQNVVTLAALLIPSLGFFAIALTTDINLGYRHILPVLPLFSVLTAVTLTLLIRGSKKQPRWFGAIVGLIGWLAVSTMWLAPDFLAFFSQLAGGPDDGWRYLVDSNLDWGQDLGGLKMWMDVNEVPEVWLSYFGEARPDYYGITYTGLDSNPPRLMDIEARPFYPHNPAPGIYAISATNLQGVHFADHDQFSWFRSQEPIAKIGYSIFLYEVAPLGEPIDLLLSGVQLDEIAAADFASLSTNQVIPHWFDAGQSWLFPGAVDHWLVLGSETAVHPHWQTELAERYELISERDNYQLFQRRTPTAETGRANAVFLDSDFGRIAFLDSVVFSLSENQLVLQTVWRQEGAQRPLQIFIHVVDSAGNIAAQWDGLGVHWRGWRANDTLWQTHEISLPGEMGLGSYQIWLGIYHPSSGIRWQTAAGEDRLLLTTITNP